MSEGESWKSSMRRTYAFHYGKHRGKKLGDVPADYLLWMADQSWCPLPVLEYVTQERDSLEKEANEARFKR